MAEPPAEVSAGNTVQVVLFDNRRGTCHCLLLSFWVRCGGARAFLAQLGRAAAYLAAVAAEDPPAAQGVRADMDTSAPGARAALLWCTLSSRGSLQRMYAILRFASSGSVGLHLNCFCCLTCIGRFLERVFQVIGLACPFLWWRNYQKQH